MFAGFTQTGAGGIEEVIKIGLELLGQRDRRDVAAQIQSVGRRERTSEPAVGVFRHVAAEILRRVDEHAPAVNEPLVERQAVDEGLERRAGTAPREHAVHLAGDGVAEEVDAADVR